MMIMARNLEWKKKTKRLQDPKPKKDDLQVHAKILRNRKVISGQRRNKSRENPDLAHKILLLKDLLLPSGKKPNLRSQLKIDSLKPNCSSTRRQEALIPRQLTLLCERHLLYFRLTKQHLAKKNTKEIWV